MKRYNSFWVKVTASFFLVALIASAFWVGNVYATTGCFSDTNGNWAETYICWMKDNGITGGTGGGNYSPDTNVTRAEMAVFMQRIANVPPQTGLILITPGNSNWQNFNSSVDTSYINYSTYTDISKATTGIAIMTIQPSIPTVLYGRNLQLVGVEFCYAASANATLSYVEINTFTSSTGAGARSMRFSDGTVFTDSACHYYVLSAPVTLTAEDGVSFYIEINWVSPGADFKFSRTTFVLQPTGMTAIAPSSLSNNVITLSEAKGGTDIPSTSAP